MSISELWGLYRLDQYSFLDFASPVFQNEDVVLKGREGVDCGDRLEVL